MRRPVSPFLFTEAEESAKNIRAWERNSALRFLLLYDTMDPSTLCSGANDVGGPGADAYGIITAGRKTAAFPGNAAAKRRYGAAFPV